MEIFNVGILEFLFLLLLAFLVLGPKKTVELAGEIGRWLKEFVKSPFWRDIVRTSQDLKEMPRKLMDDAEIQKTIDEIESATRVVNEQLHQPGNGNNGGVGTILPPDSEKPAERADDPEQDLP
jgi:Sec-independent protein translocase protein TatA